MTRTPGNGAGSLCYLKNSSKLGIVCKQEWKVKPALPALNCGVTAPHRQIAKPRHCVSL